MSFSLPDAHARPRPFAAASLAVAAVAVLLLSGCATQPASELPAAVPEEPVVQPPLLPPEPPPPVIVPPVVKPPVTPPPPAAGWPRSLASSGAGPAVLALNRQAQQARAAGRHDAALGQLERALRIEPRNAFIWQALAEAHLALRHADQAENAAQKSSSLARGNPFLEAGNWRLIAAARAERGDVAGARHATTRADGLMGGLPEP